MNTPLLFCGKLSTKKILQKRQRTEDIQRMLSLLLLLFLLFLLSLLLLLLNFGGDVGDSLASWDFSPILSKIVDFNEIIAQNQASSFFSDKMPARFELKMSSSELSYASSLDYHEFVTFSPFRHLLQCWHHHYDGEKIIFRREKKPKPKIKSSLN